MHGIWYLICSVYDRFRGSVSDLLMPLSVTALGHDSAVSMTPMSLTVLEPCFCCVDATAGSLNPKVKENFAD